MDLHCVVPFVSSLFNLLVWKLKSALLLTHKYMLVLITGAVSSFPGRAGACGMGVIAEEGQTGC